LPYHLVKFIGNSSPIASVGALINVGG
jgi:hypothetical protein